jgi:transcriptional regulator with XRE-family HTH domain
MGRGRHSNEAAEFGERVRVRRLRLHLTQETLAEKCGLHFTYVGSVERGERNVTLQTIVRLARALDVDPGRLVRGL